MSGDVHVRFSESEGVRLPLATHLVILCRSNATAALAEARHILSRIGLTLNEEKMRIHQASEGPFDSEGYSFGVQDLFGSGRPYLAALPAKRSVRRLKAKLRRMVGHHMSWQTARNRVRDVNRVVHGWLDYFSYGTLWKMYGLLKRFLQRRVRAWLVHKHWVGSHGERRFPARHMYDTMGLVCPTRVLGARWRVP